MKPEEVAAMRPTPAPVLSPDHPRVEDAIRNIVNAHFGSTPTSTPPMSGGLGRTTSNADLRASQAGRAQARRSVTPEPGIPETHDGFKSPGAAARKGLQEIADYPTGRFVDDRSHPIVDGNWTTTHLGEHKGHPSKTTVTSTIDRLPGWKSGKPSPGPVRTTYEITTRYGPTTNDGKRYKFKTKPILVSHIRPHHLVGSEDLIMGDVHPTIRDTMMDHIRRHDTTLHPESPDVTELSSGRVLPTTMGGGSLSVGTVREHEFSKRGPMDEGDSILKEEHDDLIKEISPVMWIHKDSIYGGGHEDGHDHNSLAQMILSDYGKRPEGNYSDQVLGLGGWTRLMKVGKNQFEIESASHDALRHSVRRIQPHIAGQKVRLEVRDPNNDDPAHVWSRSNVDAEQLGDYIKHGHQARSLRSNSILKEVTTGTGRPIDIEQGERLGNLKDSLKRKLEMQRSSGIEDNATYKDAPHAFRRQDSTRDKLARILQLMSAKGGDKNATKASNDNRTNRNDYRNYYKK